MRGVDEGVLDRTDNALHLVIVAMLIPKAIQIKDPDISVTIGRVSRENVVCQQHQDALLMLT